MKNNKGITLASLIIVIIILIIIASVSIYSGVGTIKYAKFNKAKSEIELVQSYVNTGHQEYIASGKNEDVLNKYGIKISDYLNSGDKQTGTVNAINKTVQATGITEAQKQDYQLLTEKQLKEQFGINASFDFIVNIKTRDVILLNGLSYNGNTYFTADSFGIRNVTGDSFPKTIEFELSQGDNTDIIIEDLIFKDNNNIEIKEGISKFNVKYCKVINETPGDYVDVTNNLTKFTERDETKYRFKVPEVGVTYKVNISLAADKNISNEAEIIPKGRANINVGDYIKYQAPARTPYKLLAQVSGHGDSGTAQNINQEYRIWRVMNINDDGSMDIVANVEASNQVVNFKGALGYNNGVFSLNDMCSYLYKNDDLGITARSINMEDITNNMIEGEEGKGINKLEKDKKDAVANLTLGANAVTKNTTNNTVTYIKSISHYPDIYEHQEGAGIDTENVLQKGTNGVIGESEDYYMQPTNNTIKQATNNLTVKHTFLSVSTEQSDYVVNKFWNTLYRTGIKYFVASRYTLSGSNSAFFGLRLISNATITGSNLYSSADTPYESIECCICPIAHLPPTVQVTSSSTASTNINTPHEVIE